MSDLTPLEAAESLERKAELFPGMADLLLYAASYLRKIAAGEYRRALHGHWEQEDCSKWPICSNCGKPTLSRGYCPAYSSYCPSCGARMDERDDNDA